jgi:hypothetical protein
MLSHLTAVFMTMINQENINAEEVLHLILDQVQDNDWQDVLRNARSKERRKPEKEPAAS